MKTSLKFIPIILLLVSCSKERRPIARMEDYQSYLINRQVGANNLIEEEMEFWNSRLSKNPEDEAALLKLAGLHASLFKSTGLVDHILKSDSIYLQVLTQYQNGNVEIFQTLSANAISQHQFQLAKQYAEKALALKDKKAATLLILVDVSLELGDYAQANRLLKQFINKNSFAYLIRDAKVKDHEGHLDSAIVRMEKAFVRIKGNRALAQWTLSNLADMYGHAGRIDDAYQAYLKVLKDNPADDYALRGIAWIALSHDHNTADAKNIINNLRTRKRMPEAHLMLAEIATMEENELERVAQLKKFATLVSEPNYKRMYNKYLAILRADDLNNSEGCVAIAKEEIANRPTPQSYDLLAWGYYRQGKFKEALDIAFRYVKDQSFEPDSYYHLGMIYQANGYKEEARHYLVEALESKFELGPSLTNKIEAAIQNL